MRRIILFLIRQFHIDFIFNYLKPSIEDDRGQASARRLTALLVCVLYTYGNYNIYTRSTDSDLLFNLSILNACFILTLYGIISVQNILTALKITNKNKTKEDENNQ